MFNVTRQIQGSGINYEDATYNKYKMLARRIKMGQSTFGASDDPNFNYSNILYDHDDNIYVIAGAGNSSTTPEFHGVTVTKYNKYYHDFGTFAWSYFYGIMGHDLYIRDAASSNYGHIAVVGERTDADDAFVMVINSSGTLEIYDTWSPNTSTRDLYATSCFWWSDGAHTSGDDLSLSVICHNNWYGYGGNPWSSPMLLRYGFGTSTNYIAARNNNMAAQGSGYYKIMGDSKVNWNPLARPFRNQPTSDAKSTGDNGYFQMMCEYGSNSAEQDYVYSLTSHYPYGYNYRRSGKNYQNIERPTNSNYKVVNGNYRGKVVLQDFRYGYQSFSSYNYSFYNVHLRSSSGQSDYSTFMLVKQDASGNLSWVKTWTGYGTSTYFGNFENGLDDTRSQNIVIPDNTRSATQTYTYPDAIDGGIYVPYRSAQNTVTVLQFDVDGDVLQAVDFSITSGTDIRGYSLGSDRKGNVFLNMKVGFSTSGAMGTWRHIKVPPFGFWNVPSSQTLSVDSNYTTDDVTISQATFPTIVDQTSNVSSYTVSAFSYGNPSAAYLRYRHENSTDLGCVSSGDLCIIQTYTSSSPHYTSQEVSD